MTTEKQLYLFNTYAVLFPSIEAMSDPSLSCLAFGIECEEGWFDLLEDMMKKIMELKPLHFQFTQIKEKYGTLRVYWFCDGCDTMYTDISAIIAEAEEASEHICQECGKPGVSQKIQGWFFTLCDEHTTQYENHQRLFR